jgi:carboxylesterase type B
MDEGQYCQFQYVPFVILIYQTYCLVRITDGDPNLVTICGQSSGGTSVFALLAAPASRGLYQRAISLSGSPNITLSMDAAERQNEGIITQSGCSKPGFTPAQIVSCMRDMGTKALVALIPEAWNTPHLFDLPMAVQGEGWEGLVIVDGHTITQPYDIALHLGDVSSNVPFMVGAMGQEPDEWPDHNFQGSSPDQWRDYLVGAFAPWDEVRRAKNVSSAESVGEEVFRLYAADSPQKAFDSIVSDYGQSCATLQIARQARPPLGKYAADIFMFVNQYHLSTPFNTTPEYTVRHASHVYDLLMAMETWHAFDSDISGPYVPDARDLAGSALLQRLWYAFMRTGNPTPEGENNTDSRERMTQWKPVDRTKDWPASYNTYVIRSDGNAHSETVENYNREKCDLFAEIGVSQKQFWWCN